MTFTVEKPKISKGLSYVLKSSALKDEIDTNELDCNVHLVYWTPQLDNRQNCSLIEAEFWLPNENVPNTRFYIRTGVVPSENRKNAETILKSQVLNPLIDWMKKRMNEPVNSTTKAGWFRTALVDGSLEIKMKE